MPKRNSVTCANFGHARCSGVSSSWMSAVAAPPRETMNPSSDETASAKLHSRSSALFISSSTSETCPASRRSSAQASATIGSSGSASRSSQVFGPANATQSPGSYDAVIASCGASLISGSRHRVAHQIFAVTRSIDDDDRDVVTAAGLERQSQQLLGRPLRIVERCEAMLHRVSADFIREAVGADEKPLAPNRWEDPVVERWRRLSPERPRNDVPKGMISGLLTGDHSSQDHFFDLGVVDRELLQLPIDASVDARIANIEDHPVRHTASHY